MFALCTMLVACGGSDDSEVTTTAEEESPTYSPFTAEETTALREGFSWEDTEELPEVDDQGRPTLYYAIVLIKDYETFVAAEEAGIPMDSMPLFGQEHERWDRLPDGTSISFEGDSHGSFAFAFLPGEIYNMIRQEALDGYPPFEVVILRHTPQEVCEMLALHTTGDCREMINLGEVITGRAYTPANIEVLNLQPGETGGPGVYLSWQYEEWKHRYLGINGRNLPDETIVAIEPFTSRVRTQTFVPAEHNICNHALFFTHHNECKQELQESRFGVEVEQLNFDHPYTAWIFTKDGSWSSPIAPVEFQSLAEPPTITKIEVVEPYKVQLSWASKGSGFRVVAASETHPEFNRTVVTTQHSVILDYSALAPIPNIQPKVSIELPTVAFEVYARNAVGEETLRGSEREYLVVDDITDEVGGEQ